MYYGISMSVFEDVISLNLFKSQFFYILMVSCPFAFNSVTPIKTSGARWYKWNLFQKNEI